MAVTRSTISRETGMKQKIRTVLSIIAVMGFAGSSALAQDTLTLSCQDAINIALKRSYTIKSYEYDLASVKHSYDYHFALFKPRIDFELVAPSLSEQVQPTYLADGLPVYNSNGLTQVGGDLSFTYMLPTGGNLALSTQLYKENLKTVLAQKDYETLKSKQATSSVSLSFRQPILTKNTKKENLREAEFNFELTSHVFSRQQLNIVYRVTEQFYSLYKLSREVEIDTEKLANSEEAYRIAQLMFKAGRIPEGDLLIAEVNNSSNKANLLESKGELAEEQEAFKHFIGLDREEDIAIITDLEYDSYPIDENIAIEKALGNRNEIQEKELEIALQEISVDRAKRTREISGNISAYYDLTGVSTVGSGSTGTLFDSSFDNFIDRPPNRGISLTFSYPVFDWGRGAAQVEKATVDLKKKQLQRQNLTKEIELEVKTVCRRVADAINRLTINEKNHEIAQKSYDISKMRFENGDISSQELGQQQESLAENQLRYLDSFIAYQLATADLKRLTLWDFRNNRSYVAEAD